MSVVRLKLRGHIPAKKSLYRRGKNGRLFLDEAVKAQIDALAWQAKAQWKRRSMQHPDVDVELFITNIQSDRDGKLVTILDVLQKAGVIQNDNVAHFNGTVVIWPAVVGPQEGVILDLTEQQTLLEPADSAPTINPQPGSERPI